MLEESLPERRGEWESLGMLVSEYKLRLATRQRTAIDGAMRTSQWDQHGAAALDG
jgi:hypothetical protein